MESCSSEKSVQQQQRRRWRRQQQQQHACIPCARDCENWELATAAEGKSATFAKASAAAFPVEPQLGETAAAARATLVRWQDGVWLLGLQLS